MIRAQLSLLVPLLSVAALTGCQQNQLTYQQAYEQKQYPVALEKAAPVALDDHAQDRQRAALVAGMSAQAMGKYDEAKKWLLPLKYCSDKDVAARARASLGLIAKAQGNQAEAANYLSQSGDQLDGDDAAKAKINAGDAYRKLGLENKARQEYKAASSEADDPGLKAAADQKAKPTTYFVQCGAFSSRQAAEKQAVSVRNQTAKAGQPAPTVLQTAPNGTPLYVVQIGPYADRQQAMAAKAKMNLPSAAILGRQ